MDAATIAALLKLREVLIAQVKKTEVFLRDLIVNIEHLITGRWRTGYAGHGRGIRMVLTILREPPEPLTLRTLSLEAMESWVGD